MAYRYDEDLEFLSNCENSELRDLYDCLVYDKNRKKRLSETLSNSPEFKVYGVKYSNYWKRIAEELQKFGGNTVANVFRSQGVTYHEIIKDVAKELRVEVISNSVVEESTESIEEKLILKVFKDSWDRLNTREKSEFISEMKFSEKDLKEQGIVALVQLCLRAGGYQSFRLTAMIVNAILVNLLGRGITFGGLLTLSNAFGLFVGPIGWLITGTWSILDLASPAKRVTIPAVFQIALLRRAVNFKLTPHDSSPIPVILKSGEIIEDNTEIDNQYKILGIEYAITKEELEEKYRESIENCSVKDLEDPLVEKLNQYKIKEIERAYNIITGYMETVHHTFDPNKLIIKCLKCDKKNRIPISEGKYKCGNCGKIHMISKNTENKNTINFK